MFILTFTVPITVLGEFSVTLKRYDRRSKVGLLSFRSRTVTLIFTDDWSAGEPLSVALATAV